jgi:NADPH:quinone reductase
MRAIVLQSFSGPLVVSEIADPVAGTDEVLVELRYGTINPLDVWCCNGNFAHMTPLPHVPGAEGLGTLNGKTVIVNGTGVGISRAGTYAQRIAVPASSITLVPDDLDPLQAASLGIAGVTAYRCLVTKGLASAGDSVLVTGASGGVGSLVVQLAHQRGIRVLAQTSNPDKADELFDLGADRVIVASGGDDLPKALDGETPNIVVDGVAGNFVTPLIECLAPNGRYVNYGTSGGTAVAFDMRTLYRKGITLSGYTGFLEVSRDDAFEALFDALRSGQLRVPIDAVLPLAEAGAAHARILAKGVRGKLLLDVQA